MSSSRVFRLLVLCLVLGLGRPAVGQQVGVGSGGGLGSGAGVPIVTGPPLPEPLPEGLGAITGVVIDATSGAPIPGAVVALTVSTRAPIGRTGRQLTDGLGRFVFTKLPARADYQIVASKSGYFDAAFGQENSRVGSASRIELADGQWFRSARLALVKAGAISGTVVDERGEPVVGVYVRVLLNLMVAGTRRLAAGPIATTDDRGAYRIAGLGPGEYTVCVPSVQASVPPSQLSAFAVTTSPADAMLDAVTASRLALTKYPLPPPPANGQLFMYPITYSPGGTSIRSVTPITLQIGEERRGADVRIEPAGASRVSGRVEGPASAIAGLTLRLMAAGLEDLGSGSEAATTVVGADGSFMFLNVPAGAYTLDATRTMTEYVYGEGGGSSRLPLPPWSNGGSMTSSNLVSGPRGTQSSTQTTANPGEKYWGRSAVTVAGADVTDVALALHRGVTIAGRFTWENAQPQNPFVSAFAEPAGGEPSLGIPRNSKRPFEPEFSVEGLLSGAYFLRFTSNGYIVKSVTWNGRDYADRPFDASEGRDFTDVAVTLTDQAPVLLGTVRGPDGTTAADAAVIVFPVDQVTWSTYGATPRRIVSGRVSSAGVVRFATLPEGEYFAVAVPPADASAWQDPAFLRRVAGSAMRVSLKWGQTSSVNLTLGPGR